MDATSCAIRFITAPRQRQPLPARVLGKRKISLSAVLARHNDRRRTTRRTGIADPLYAYGVKFVDHENNRLEPVGHLFQAKVLPMSPEELVTVCPD